MTGIEDFISSDHAPYGKFYCNPPESLFQRMLSKMLSIKPEV
jgi:hypothetical protein